MKNGLKDEERILRSKKISWMSILGAVLITLGVIFANKSTEK